MVEIIISVLLSIIAICLIIIVLKFSKVHKSDKTAIAPAKQQPENSTPSEHPKNTVASPHTIPDDVVFDERNLPVRTARSRKKKVNYGKDFNAFLVKGGTIYHKRSCKKLNGKKINTKHIYECIADKNKKACPICKPRTEIHEWYKVKFPDSFYVTASEEKEAVQLSLFDVTTADE